MFIADHIFQASRLTIQITAQMTPGQTQKTKATTRTHLRIKTCLYLSLNKRAKSLSTLMALIVYNDTDTEMIAPMLRIK